MRLDSLIPPKIHEDIIQLAKCEPWATIETSTRADGLPATTWHIRWDRLKGVSTFIMDKLLGRGLVHYFDLAVGILKDGPKLFYATEEQFESMEHVELNIPPSDFRAPFPGMVFKIPTGAKRRIAAEVGLMAADVPDLAALRFREVPGEPTMVMIMTPVPQRPYEEWHVFTDHPGNPTIESVIRRRCDSAWTVGNQDADRRTMAEIICRACLNLCLMLTHYGCQITGPVDPKAYEKHRRKKSLERFKYGDCLAVELKQHVTVRELRGPSLNTPGPGTGIEYKPHWRRGHWRAYPGQAARRHAGEKVDLLFVKPTLVRRDRLVGEMSQTEATYTA